MNLCRIDRSVGERLARNSSFKRLVHPAPDGEGYLITGCTLPVLSDVDGLEFNPDTAEPFAPDPDQWAEAASRLVLGWAANANEELPEAVKHEIDLLLYAQPGLRLEYMGRGRFAYEHHLPDDKINLLTVDIAGGRRNYLFRKLLGEGGIDERTRVVNSSLESARLWISDPGAKLVLSIGGGGFRLFAATAILKVIDRMLDSRDGIAEVWGSSGGAFLGYSFANGFSPNVVDELGFDLYHGRHKHLVDGSTGSLVRANLVALANRLRGRETDAEMAAWLDEIDRKEPVATRRHPSRPFFAMASNTRKKQLTALTDKRYIQSYCEDILLACDPRDAVAASTAVPFLLRAQRGITGTGDDQWVDGSVADENPLSLPYIKWLREREHEPDTTPKRLKIILINLNLRSTESRALRMLSRLPVIKQLGLVERAAGLIDTLLDAKTSAAIQMMTARPEVELLSLKLELGNLNFKDPDDIPAAIRSGRAFESWRITMHGKGF
ncbi:MAG: patatin-like phospholipase family protein [Myxococcota bacterium]